MVLCAVIGDDEVGRYIAAHLGPSLAQSGNIELRYIALRAAEHWLQNYVADFDVITALEFRRFVELLKMRHASEVIFAGGFTGSINFWKIDRTAIRGAREMALWWPHAYYRKVRNLLVDADIKLGSVLTYLPDLCCPRGTVFGGCNDYDPIPDLMAAKARLEALRSGGWKRVQQFHIVDTGDVMISASPRTRTDRLLREYGQSHYRRTEKFPVLCKLSTSPFENIDIPIVGYTTVRRCVENGIRAIVFEADKTIVMQREQFSALTAQSSICVCAV